MRTVLTLGREDATSGMTSEQFEPISATNRTRDVDGTLTAALLKVEKKQMSKDSLSVGKDRGPFGPVVAY